MHEPIPWLSMQSFYWLASQFHTTQMHFCTNKVICDNEMYSTIPKTIIA